MTKSKQLKPILISALLSLGSAASAQDVALLLFDAKTSTKFAGCLNCNEYDDAAVCNEYGSFGSEYENDSIWNEYGRFGSEYQADSPWNEYSEGLIVVDPEGNFYGQFTLNEYARWGQSSLPVVQALLELYEAGVELDKLRDMLCEQ